MVGWGFVGLKTDLHWQGWVCFCRAKAATYIGRVGFGFVGRPFRATWWGGVCRAKAATYIGRGGFGFVGRPFRATWWGGVCRLIHNPAFNIQKNLPCSKTGKYCFYGFYYYQNIQPQRKVFDVVEVVFDFYASVVCVSSVSVNNLRPTRNTWLNHMAVCIERNFNTELIHKHTLFRTRANNTHIALKHVYKLWNLI